MKKINLTQWKLNKLGLSKGISSAEIIASVAILSLITLVVLSVLIVNQLAWNESLVNVRLQDEAKKPMQAIIKELKEADPSALDINISADQRTITFAVPQTIDAGAIASWREITFSFDASTNQISRTVNDTVTSVIGRQISNLTFSNFNNIITVALTATATTADGKTLNAALTSQAVMRN